MIARRRSIDCSTLATRPNASAAGAEADDFAIVGPFEPPHDLDRIGGRIRVVEALVETIELGFQRANRHPGSHMILACVGSC